MAAINIEGLFDEKRCPDGLALILLILYFPLGLLIAVVRLFIGFHTFLAACILPKVTALRSMTLRTMCGVIGILVSLDGSSNRDSRAKMLVANYTTTLDHLAVDLVLPNILPSVWDLPPVLMWMLGYTDMGAKKGRQTLINNAKKHCQTGTIPLLAFPEGASTNGRSGLLKFSIWPFSLDQPVQPVIIKVSRPPVARIAPSVLGGRWWLDIFWFLFVPYTYFYVKLLPVVTPGEEETPEEFTRRVQAVMAAALQVQCTAFTSADKVEHAKRKLFVQRQQAGGNGARGIDGADVQSNDPLVVMTRQVKDVLPHVPLEVIRSDLVLTKDVDLTITNILEGRVTFSPETPGVAASPSYDSVPSLLSESANKSSVSQPTSGASPSSSPGVSESFSKHPRDRHMSLECRKRALLESARKKYLEKPQKT